MTEQVKLEAKDVSNEVFMDKLERFIDIAISDSIEDSLEIETFTNGGVNMFITLEKNSKQSLFEQFIEYANYFDVDEEIDKHRQDERYRGTFTIRQSLEDFEEYKDTLEGMISNLKIVTQS